MVVPDATTGMGFADQGIRGASAPWRAVLALALVLGGTFLLVQLTVILYLVLGLEDALRRLADPAGRSPGLRAELLGFAFLMVSIIASLPLMRLVLPWLHRRPWLSFITAKPRFDWTLFGRSLAAMLGLGLASLALTLALSPDALQWTADWRKVTYFAPLALALLPLQALAEEILFRGYFTQLAGRLTRRRSLRLLLPALIFAAAHSANPEAQFDFVWASANYLLLALYLGAITLRSDGIEAAYGAHLGANLYAALIVGSAVSVSPGPTLWQSGAPDFQESLLQTALLLALHYLLVFGPAAKGRPRAKQ